MHNLKNNSKINICKFSTRQGRTEAFWRPGQINRNTLFYKIAPPNSQFGTPKLTLYLPPPLLATPLQQGKFILHPIPQDILSVSVTKLFPEKFT